MGRSDITIAPLVLGGNVFGWTADTRTSFKILDAFISAGFDAIDTADVYSCWVPDHVGGESEMIIGQWLKSRGARHSVVLATKFGASMPNVGKGLSAAHIKKSVDGSLARLQTDYIDLYQAHHDDPDVPLEETLGALDELVRLGKVRTIGASHYDPGRLGTALDASQSGGLARYETFQPRYNLCDRFEYEGAVQAACISNDVGVLCYSTLAKGYLTGKYRSEADIPVDLWGPDLTELVMRRYLNDRGARILAVLQDVALEQGAAPAEIALAWLTAQAGVTAPIAAVTSVEQFEEIKNFARLRLDERQKNALSEASAR